MLEIPPLPARTILLVEVGSTAHGTGLPGGEDHDEMGVVVESPEDVLGLREHGFRTVMQRTQPEGSRSGPGDTDRTLFSLPVRPPRGIRQPVNPHGDVGTGSPRH